jgi:hypothetical protein
MGNEEFPPTRPGYSVMRLYGKTARCESCFAKRLRRRAVGGWAGGTRIAVERVSLSNAKPPWTQVPIIEARTQLCDTSHPLEAQSEALREPIFTLRREHA